jgi:hypothetical protein
MEDITDLVYNSTFYMYGLVINKDTELFPALEKMSYAPPQSIGPQR